MRGEWRRFTGDLSEEGESFANDNNVEFDIGAVNIEEHGSKLPVNYVLPPQLQREIQAGTQQLTRLNEQSLLLRVSNLEDGQAQAAFRTVQMDMRSFKKMEMFVHAESVPGCAEVDNDDLRVFVRVGTDFTENYYEYEMPVSITPPPIGRYDNNSVGDQELVWPLENNMVIDFEELFRAKRERNEKIQAESGVLINQRYKVELGSGNKIYVVGNPNLADVRVVMIGIRNPAKRNNNPLDDGLPKCVEIWANELRLTHFDQNSGEAAIGRISANLADLATVSLTGSISTPGWGQLESSVSERLRETITTIDASAQVQLDKFLPEETGLKVPMYVGYSKNTSTPQFAPEEPDTPMEIYLDQREPDVRDSLLQISQKITERRSINFTNVRKEKTGDGKPRFYDISNLSATYAFTETRYQDFNTEYDFLRNYRGALAYSYTSSAKPIEPLKDVKFLRKSNYLRLIRDFNFSLVPKTVAVRTELDRKYGERQVRNINPEAQISLPPFVNKSFNWLRAYNLSYDLAKSLKLDYSGSARALIREFEGQRVSKKDDVGGYNELGEPSYEAHRDSVLNSLKDMGLTTNYNHNISASYNLPLNKIPLTDWISSTARYSASYDWKRGPLTEPGIEDTVGHTVSNGQQIQLNANLNLTTLYNKVPYLRNINRGKPGRSSRSKKSEASKVNDSKGGEEESKSKKGKKDQSGASKIIDGLLRTMMSVKSVSGNYTRNRGITLPGFAGQPVAMGIDLNGDSHPSPVVNPYGSPGLGFILGQQDGFGDSASHFAEYAGEQNWLLRSPNVFNTYMRSFNEQWSFRASLQPARDLRIDLTANESSSQTTTSYWNWNDSLMMFTDNNTQVVSGSYSASILSIATSLERIDSNNVTLYNAFLANRKVVSQRIGEQRNIMSRDPYGYIVGFDSAHQDVLIPAFFAAYTGQTSSKVSLNPLKTLMLPNWRINYTGLTKIEFIAKYFRTFSINHSYRSTYTVGNYLKSASTGDTFSISERVRPEYIISQVSISEQFAPLINFDMTWKNSLLTRLELRRDRNITLSTTNGQVTEIGNIEYIVGTGYTVNNLKLPFEIGGKPVQSDLTLRADFSIRDSKTVIRKIVENETQVTNGQLIYTLKITGDYSLTKALNLRLFYDWVANRPAISNTFPTSNINAGFSLRFSLSG
ncbi:MAG: hypothetical protein Kow0075_05590 [Salibacteraceae bacterium]